MNLRDLDLTLADIESRLLSEGGRYDMYRRDDEREPDPGDVEDGEYEDELRRSRRKRRTRSSGPRTVRGVEMSGHPDERWDV